MKLVLPTPDGPISASSDRVGIFRHSAAISSSRPKKRLESASENAESPG